MTAYKKLREIYMRIITGSARGRKLQSPAGQDVRPTTDVVKESVFSMIQFAVKDCVFLDAFAGSGQMGLESLSRGAEKAVFVDSSKRSMNVIKKNIEICGFGSEKARTVLSDTISYLSSVKDRFDIVFLDPPYRTGLLQKALELSVNVVNDDGFIICEHPREEELPERAGGFVRQKDHRYGTIVISIYRKVQQL